MISFTHLFPLAVKDYSVYFRTSCTQTTNHHEHKFIIKWLISWEFISRENLIGRMIDLELHIISCYRGQTFFSKFTEYVCTTKSQFSGVAVSDMIWCQWCDKRQKKIIYLVRSLCRAKFYLSRKKKERQEQNRIEWLNHTFLCCLYTLNMKGL